MSDLETANRTATKPKTKRPKLYKVILENDDSVFAFGVDVPDHKRHFGSGKGMLEKFGPRRFFGSPLTEAASTG